MTDLVGGAILPVIFGNTMVPSWSGSHIMAALPVCTTFALLAFNPFENLSPLTLVVVGSVLAFLGVVLLFELMGMRYIPNTRVGVVEKLWSPRGSIAEGRLIALNGEAGFQADLLRGGFHFAFWRWQYRIHKVSLVTVPQGKIGYVYARDGQPL